MKIILFLTRMAGVPGGEMKCKEGGMVRHHCTDHFRFRSGIWQTNEKGTAV